MASPGMAGSSTSAASSALLPSSSSSPSTQTPLVTYSPGDFFIGFLVSLGSSALNAAGLNITKLDHLRNESLPRRLRRPDYTRPLWYMGLILYIASQLIGSTLALAYLRAEYVAPLGSAALIFNLVFGHWLLGEPVTRKDIIGTVTIVVGVCFVLIFSNINDGLTEADNISLQSLQRLWARAGFIAYFFVLNLVAVGLTLFANLLTEIILDLDNDDAPALGQGGLAAHVNVDRLPMRKRYMTRFRVLVEKRVMLWEVATLRKISALLWAAAGGLYASETLLLAKCAVKLGTTGLGPGQFVSFLGLLLIIILVVTAIAQVYALNMGLKMGDSTLVVPFFFGLYTAFGLGNSMIYFDQLAAYRTWTVFMLVVSVAILVAGVIMLSTVKKPNVNKRVQSGPAGASAMELNHRRRHRPSVESQSLTAAELAMQKESAGKGEGTAVWDAQAGLEDLADDHFFDDDEEDAAVVVPRHHDDPGGEHSGLMRDQDVREGEGEAEGPGESEAEPVPPKTHTRGTSSLGFLGNFFNKKDGDANLAPADGLLSDAERKPES